MHILKLEKQKKNSFVQSAFKRNKIRCLKMIRAKKNTLLFQEALQNVLQKIHMACIFQMCIIEKKKKKSFVECAFKINKIKVL